MQSTLLIVDGNALIYRAYFALPAFKTKDQIPTNAVYGFASMIYKAVDTFRPSHIIVCFDTPEPTFRNKLFAEYQMQRPKIEINLRDQFPFVKEFLTSAGIYQIEKKGFEADDLIGTIAKKVAGNFKVLIMTGDKDIFQLINPTTFVITPSKGISEIKIYNEDEVKKRFDLLPTQIPDLKALMGDPSDNYRGVPGIGPKTAARLVNKFASVENLYKKINEVHNPKLRSLLKKHKKDAMLAKKLAVIVSDLNLDIEIERCNFAGYNETLKEFFKKMEFSSLLKRYFEPKASGKKKKEEKKNENQQSLFNSNS